jgi:phosphotransferase system HPr (HPr) family protein
MSSVHSLELVVHNPTGLHARPAALFVQTAATFASQITVRNLSRAGAPTDAKSILGVLSLGVACGHRIEIVVEGPDAEPALAALVRLVEAGIGEAAEAS